MLQKLKKSTALIMCILMCISMLTCIVLPASATTPSDGTQTPDAYAEVTGTLVDANGLAAGAEGVGNLLYTKPDAGIYFVSAKFSAEAGENFTYTYGGDGWGNGVSYYLTMGKNAFKTYDEARDAAAAQSVTWAAENSATVTITSAGSTTTKPADTLSVLTPGKAIIVMAPRGSTKTDSTGSATFGVPTVTTIDQTVDPATEETVAIDPAPTDLFVLTVLGPQAGKSPVNSDKVGSLTDSAQALTIANNRSINNSKEFVFGDTVYAEGNVNMTFDGIAVAYSAKFYKYSSAVAVFTMRNCYGTELPSAKYNENNGQLFNFYSNKDGDSYWVASLIFTMENTYLDYSSATRNAKDMDNNIIGNDVTINNCVFTGGQWAADGAEDAQNTDSRILLTPTAKKYASSKFYGDAAANPEYNITNCAFVEWKSTALFRFEMDNKNWTSYSASPVQINFKDNFVYDFGYGNDYYPSGVFWTKSCNAAKEITSWSADITGNRIEFSDDFAKNKTSQYGLAYLQSSTNAAEYDVNIKDNTIIADYTDPSFVFIAYKGTSDAYMGAIDVSGNLFVDNDGNVQAARICNEPYSFAAGAGVSAQSDVYVSDEFCGGVSELFTVQETTQDLLVTNSKVEVTVPAADTNVNYLRGSVTVLPKDGVTYNTENIFTYKDENVKLLGVYSDAECKTAVTTFAKGFGTLYAKAQYKAKDSKTTATVIYTITEPTAYRVVDQDSVGTYTFNGTTYTTENDNFYTTIDNAVAAAAATDVVLLMPGTYPTVDVMIDTSVAIVGPKAFTSASDGKSNAIANSRSYTDASGEAILTAVLGFANTKASYVTVAGVAMSSSDKTFVAYTGSGAGTTKNYANQRVSFLNVTNVCVSAKTFLYVGYRVSTSGWSTSPQYDTHVNVYGSYFASKNSSPFNITANYFTIQKSAVVGTLENATASQALFYMTPVDPARLGCKPAGSVLRVENCYLSKGVTKANYLLGYRTRYWSDSKECKDDVTRDLKNHAKVILNNNTVYNETAGDRFARLMIAGANCCTVEATGNYVEYTSSSSGEFLEYNGTGSVDSKPAMDVTFSDNAFINCKVPVTLPGNSVNIDENYYGTSAGAVQLVTAGTDYGAVKDQNTYYLDAKMTTKNTDVQLVDDGYTAFETTFDGINNTTITSAKDLSVADLKTAEGATVLGVYSDAEMTTAVTGAFDADGTYYVNIQKTSSGVALQTKLTLDIPCQHLLGKADKTKRVAGDKQDATCGTDGYQKYSCSECGNTVEAWTETTPATGSHNWAGDITHADYVSSTCTTPGTNVYVCKNPDCAETPATKTEPASTVEHTKGEAMEVFADSTCMAIGLKAYKCKWFDECGKWMISTDAMNAYIGGDTATLSAYTEGVDYEIIEKQTHDFDESNWSKDESGHWHACIAAKECTAQGDFAGHTDSDVIVYEGKEATCGVDGLGYIECTVCGYVVDDAAVIPATGEHNFDNDCDATCGDCTLVRDTGHTYDNSCDTECNACFEVRVITHTFDYPCDSYCNVCGYGRTVAHADAQWKVTKAATLVSDGLEALVCTDCGREIDTRVIAKLATEDVKDVFTDVKETDWYYKNEAVSYVYNAGLIKGVTETTFNPSGAMTRGMFVTVLGRLHGVDQNSIRFTSTFTDVANGKYYSKYVVWASQAGVINGVTATKFAPDGKITREQLCAMMVRYCDYADIELKESKAAVTFSDAADISGYAKAAVATCQKAGLVQGKGNGKFDPKGTATRAEVSTILMNFYVNCLL